MKPILSVLRLRPAVWGRPFGNAVPAPHLRPTPQLFFQTQIVLLEALGLAQLIRRPRSRSL